MLRKLRKRSSNGPCSTSAAEAAIDSAGLTARLKSCPPEKSAVLRIGRECMSTDETSSGMVKIYVVYIVILGIALSQVVLAFAMGPSLSLMLMAAALQASLAVLYFMHLAQE